jgi:hypothetical protein
MKFNRQSILNKDGVTNYYCMPEGLPLKFGNKTTNSRYVGFGMLTFYKQKNKFDSIVSHDSIRLPDGKMKYGPTTLIINY